MTNHVPNEGEPNAPDATPSAGPPGLPPQGAPYIPPQPPAAPGYAPPAYQPPAYQSPAYQPPMGGGVPPGAGAAAPYGPPPGVGGLAISALIVGIAAFLFGWVPFVGIALGLVGLVLGILAVRRPRGRGLGITGIVLSTLGFLTSVVLSFLVLLSIPWAAEIGSALDAQAERSPAPGSSAPGTSAGEFDEARYSVVGGQLIETPCWSYDGPDYFTDNTSAANAEACMGELELWGEPDAAGNVVPTGVGAVYGQIGVEPVRVATAEGFAPGTDVTAIVDALQEPYFAAQGGTVQSLHEAATLDGVPANITRLASSADGTRTKAFITAYAPAPYVIEGEPAQLFIISIVTPYSNGEEQIQHVLDSWKWN